MLAKIVVFAVKVVLTIHKIVLSAQVIEAIYLSVKLALLENLIMAFQKIVKIAHINVNLVKIILQIV